MQLSRIAIIVAAVFVLILIAVGAFLSVNTKRRVVGGQPVATVPLPTDRPTASADGLTPAAQPTARPTEKAEPPTVIAVAVDTVTPQPLPSATAARQIQPTATPAPAQAAVGILQPNQVLASANAPSSQDSEGNITTFEPTNVSDGRAETAWRVAGDGRDQWVELSFTQPVEVREVQILPGYAKIDSNNGVNRFIQNRRVQRVRLEFSDGSRIEADLADLPELQPLVVNVRQTTFVRVVILKTSAPGAVDGRDYTPISEIVVRGFSS